MSGNWLTALLVSTAALGIAIGGSVPMSGQKAEPWHGVLDEHPAIQYRLDLLTIAWRH